MVGDIGGHIAATLVEVGAGDQAEFLEFAVADVLRRRLDLAGRQQALHQFIVLAVLIGPVLGVDLQAFEVALHDEVDDAGDGVRAIGRRGAAGQHFHPLDQLGRDLVEVGRGVGIAGVGIADPQPPAVDQDQGTLLAQTAQVGRGDAARTGQRV